MRILAADDELDVRLLLELALGMEPGVILTLVESGTAALDVAATSPFDLIVLDGLMPGLSGAETCRALRAGSRTADIPIVFLTALTTGEAQHPLREAGASGFVMKPFDPFTLASQLKAFVTHSG